MARPKKNKPSDPAEITARRVEARALKARGLEVNTDPRTLEITAIWRPNCFSLLLRKDRPAELDAVNWLEDLIRSASGENAQDRRPDFIRGSTEGAPGQNISQSMIDASRVLQVVEAGLRPWEARLLFGLLRPDEALLTRWRGVVQQSTGEVNPQAQGSRVRAACEALVFVKQTVEGQRKAA
jgi:hypothetical protein